MPGIVAGEAAMAAGGAVQADGAQRTSSKAGGGDTVELLPCWDTAEVDPNADFKGVTAVFGYGSLVWKPPCAAQHIASASVGFIKGWARRFWQHSVDHRGTSETPGRVATILHSSHPDLADVTIAEPDDLVTAGMVYGIVDLSAILADLDFREKNGYTRTVVDVWDAASPDRKLTRAIMYYAKPGRDPAYLGKQTDEAIASRVATAVGPSGPNTDYVFNLEAWCAENKVVDAHVASVAELTRKYLAQMK